MSYVVLCAGEIGFKLGLNWLCFGFLLALIGFNWLWIGFVFLIDQVSICTYSLVSKLVTLNLTFWKLALFCIKRFICKVFLTSVNVSLQL
jgi:uncharacterized membrane protein